MEIEIGEITSTVRVQDSQALLDPAVIEKLVAMVIKRMKDAEQLQERLKADRELRPQVTARKSATWK